MIICAEIVHKTKDLPGFEAACKGAQTEKSGKKGGNDGRPQSAGAALGSGKRKNRSRSKRRRGKSANGDRGDKSRRDKLGELPASDQGQGGENDLSMRGGDPELSFDEDKLSVAASEDEEDHRARVVPHHAGPAIADHNYPDKAYLEASMSVNVLGGELGDIIQKERPRHSSKPKKKRGKRRPDSAPAVRRGASNDATEDEDEDEDVFTRLYKEAQVVPKVRVDKPCCFLVVWGTSQTFLTHYIPPSFLPLFLSYRRTSTTQARAICSLLVSHAKRSRNY